MIRIQHNSGHSTLLRLGLACLVMLTAQSGPAAEALRILKENCMRCHGAEKRKGGLAMDTRDSLLKGGDSGMVVNLDTPGKSLLLNLLHPDADPHMPPKKQLSEAEIESIETWVEAGAKWDPEALAGLPATRSLTWQPLPVNYQPVGAMEVSPGGSRLAVGRGSRLVLFDLAEGGVTNRTEIKASLDVMQSLAWHPDETLLASGGFRRVVIWDIQSGGKEKVVRQGLVGRITAMCFVDQGKQLVIAESVPTLSGRLLVLNTSNWDTVREIRAHSDAIYDLALSPDGRTLCSSSADKLAHLWEVGSWKSLGTLEGHTDYVMASAFNPSGDRVATVSSDSTVKVWETGTRKQISTFSDAGSSLAIMGIHWTLDPASDKAGKDADWIITASEDSKPRLFTNLVLHDGTQRSTGAKMRTWQAAPAASTTLSFSPATKQVFAGDISGGITIWDTGGKLVKTIE